MIVSPALNETLAFVITIIRIRQRDAVTVSRLSQVTFRLAEGARAVRTDSLSLIRLAGA